MIFYLSRRQYLLAIGVKANLDGRFYTFDSILEKVTVSKVDSILSQAERIHARGCTNTALPMEEMLRDQYKVDNIVLITDGQQNEGQPFSNVFAQYKRKVNRGVRLFIVDVAGYGGSLVVGGDNVYQIFGWSDQVLRFISLAAQGWGNISSAIRKDPGFGVSNHFDGDVRRRSDSGDVHSAESLHAASHLRMGAGRRHAPSWRLTHRHSANAELA